MNELGYKKLILWQKADALAYGVYLNSKEFPKEEIYGITSQLRRSSLSVPLNIVEGYARNNKKEFKNFLRIAAGSLSETEYLLSFCARLGYLKEVEYRNLEEQRKEVGRILWRFLSKI